MRLLILIAALLALSLFVSVNVNALELDQEALLADPEFASFLEEQSLADQQFEAELSAELENTPAAAAGADFEEEAPVKERPMGTIQRGGIRVVRGPNFRKGAADGSTLPPYDPFGINWRHTKRNDRREKKRQAKIEKENEAERCKQMKIRAKARAAVEKREQEEAKAEAAAEEAKRKAALGIETDLLEVESNTEMDAEMELDAELTTESDAELDAEAAADMQAELDAEAEAEADAAESAADMMEMEADVDEGFGVDVDIESEMEDEQAFMELEAEKKKKKEQVTPIVHKSTEPRLVPSSHVTYGRELLSEELFDNKDSRAVFARRARGKEIVRFQRLASSSAGQAVVNGVTKLPCGKEITDKGLFGAVVSSNPGPTVEAANPQAPVLVDQNIPVIKKLPVVPQFHEGKVADEYGDM